MKYIIISLASFSLLMACGKKTSSEATEPTEETATVSLEQRRVEMSAEQQKSAGIKIASPAKTMMHSPLSCTGYMQLPSEATQRISVGMAGRIVKMNLSAGARVQKGDLLAVLNDPEYIKLQEQYLTSIERIKLQESELKRVQTLAAGEATATKNVESAMHQLQTEKIKLQSIEQQLFVIGFDPAAIKQSGIQANLNIKAPVSGIITLVQARQGQFVEPGTPLLELAESGKWQVELKVFSKDLGKIALGQAVTIQIPGAAKTYTALVTAILPTSEASSQASVLAKIPQADVAMVSGLMVKASVATRSYEAYVLPASAILRFGETFVAYTENGRYFERHELKGNLQDDVFELYDAGFADQKFVTEGVYYIDATE
jgi:cobalt-zinc-cadmium efflux system membrane fusion protein